MLADLVEYLAEYLRIAEVIDYPDAYNGLQLANSGALHRVAAAVDATEPVIARAVAQQADLLVVHHGLFWGGTKPIVGAYYRKLRKAIAADLAIYSVHLPLDFHPEIGNNALLASRIGLTNSAPFLFQKGRANGLAGEIDCPRSDFLEKLERLLDGPVWSCPGGPEQIRRLGVVTGGAGSMIEQAAAEGVDTFLTGEGPHHTYGLARELGINLVYGGHYATETFGVKALAELIAKRYACDWFFIDDPSHL